jgi:hypothetical protein
LRQALANRVNLAIDHSEISSVGIGTGDDSTVLDKGIERHGRLSYQLPATGFQQNLGEHKGQEGREGG